MTETFQVKSLEEMPRALTYLIEKVDSLQETVNTLRHKQQASESPRWILTSSLRTPKIIIEDFSKVQMSCHLA